MYICTYIYIYIHIHIPIYVYRTTMNPTDLDSLGPIRSQIAFDKSLSAGASARQPTGQPGQLEEGSHRQNHRKPMK